MWREVGGQRTVSMRLDGDRVGAIGFESAFTLLRTPPSREAGVVLPVLLDGAEMPTAAELPDVEPDDFDLRTVPERFARIGDPHAAIDDVAHDITPLLEWSERDEAAGQGDMPYPPDHPKMPGEPKRVQPSKDRDRPRD